MATKVQKSIALTLAHEVADGTLSPAEFVSRFFEIEAKRKGYSSGLSQERYVEYLQALQVCRGRMVQAARRCKVHPYAVQRVMKKDVVFRGAVEAIQDYFQAVDLEALEKVSVIEAKKPKNVSERKFQLKALHPGKYRPYSRDVGPTQINISFGFQVPARRYGMEKLSADVQETPQKPKKGGKKAISPVEVGEAMFDCVK